MFLKNVIYFLKFLTYLLSRPFGNIIMNLSFYLDSVMQNSVVVWLIGCAHFRARFLFFIPMDTSDIFSQRFFLLKVWKRFKIASVWDCQGLLKLVFFTLCFTICISVPITYLSSQGTHSEHCSCNMYICLYRFQEAVSLKAVRCVSGRKIYFFQTLPKNLPQSKSNRNHLGFLKQSKIIFFFLRENRFSALTLVFNNTEYQKWHKLPSSSFYKILVQGVLF